MSERIKVFKCPNCGEVIKLDKSEYDLLLNEVRNDEFAKTLFEFSE